MRRSTTKLIAFTFLLIVSVPVLLSLKFILKEILIQQEAEEKMKTEALLTIRIAKADIKWVKPGKEILVYNKLFDVKQFVTENDIVTLTGFFDDEETALFSDLKKYMEGSREENPFSELAFKFHFTALYNCHAEIRCSTSWHLISNPYHSFASVLPLAPILSFTQPPKLLPGLCI